MHINANTVLFKENTACVGPTWVKQAHYISRVFVPTTKMVHFFRNLLPSEYEEDDSKFIWLKYVHFSDG